MGVHMYIHMYSYMHIDLAFRKPSVWYKLWLFLEYHKTTLREKFSELTRTCCTFGRRVPDSKKTKSRKLHKKQKHLTQLLGH